MHFGPDNIGVEGLYWYRTIPIPFDKPIMLTPEEIEAQRGLIEDKHIFVRTFKLDDPEEMLVYERVLNRLKQTNIDLVHSDVNFSQQYGWTAIVVWAERFYRVIDPSVVDKRPIAEDLKRSE